ncbi:hypothetical protein O3P69_010332 [Scylla paramamosain]|uniref:Uncharacterized protein n=1 Tax=Scylla paramamosain TaxID=85552 RepID=A0AAW0TS12_SCYPA
MNEYIVRSLAPHVNASAHARQAEHFWGWWPQSTVLDGGRDVVSDDQQTAFEADESWLKCCDAMWAC